MKIETDTLFVNKIPLDNDQAFNIANDTIIEKECEHLIDHANWEIYPYKPKVSFKIAHNGYSILIRFYITEKYIRAIENKINSTVYKDSCLEFFISFNGNDYYNIEINCIGVIHMAYGNCIKDRQLIDKDIIGKIIVNSTLGTIPFDTKTGRFSWNMTVIIPVDCFIFSKAKLGNMSTAWGNFYKCGDELPEKHYLSWNPIKISCPNFHKPEFFKRIIFV
jgi:hypothetical protein